MMLALWAGLLGGCSDKLETGYKPRPLTASPAMRRSFYASPFTPEAKAPELEREQEFEARRPRPGY
ncbi:MAG TPA: hypothetical protein VNL70_02075 [Tepidisphaeraceae bacterium]|nr:hypothetical protein [Tepidisphaeraceae bacterium]